MGKKGFTLIETVIVIIVLAITLTPFSVLTTNVISRNVRSQGTATAVSLAEQEMERVTALRFSLAVDEAAASFSAPFNGFTKEIIVDYVNSGSLNTPVAGPTDYKRVQVKVTSATADTITLTTLITNDW
ncbi:MAG: prepilin-type N-terminal cleavage/methylation domain-containing protein [Candidatus Omnitrophica bacterium]|nr:prepilin-type N-terminal cleavage/methylation domain-containing protein [Candidatus Omnitrophota bacterium]